MFFWGTLSLTPHRHDWKQDVSKICGPPPKKKATRKVVMLFLAGFFSPLIFEPSLGGGFKYVLFSRLFGEDSNFDEHIFQMG